eukprot:5587914-Prymnesium_polylepis.3
MLSILISDKRWRLIRDSPQQKRYVYDAIQLVVTRYTCIQWRSDVPCRNCSNPHWRAACQNIKHIYHVLPPLNARNCCQMCESFLNDLHPLASKVKDATQHQTRLPQMLYVKIMMLTFKLGWSCSRLISHGWSYHECRSVIFWATEQSPASQRDSSTRQVKASGEISTAALSVHGCTHPSHSIGARHVCMRAVAAASPPSAHGT